MGTRDRGVSTPYFMLLIFGALLVPAMLAPDQELNTVQVNLLSIGISIFIIGGIYRIVQKSRKISQTRSIRVQTIGTIIAVLASLSSLL